MTRSASLEARGLSVTAPTGRTLVRDLDVHLADEVIGLIGRNGVGKTTLVETLAGARAASAGTVTRARPSILVGQELTAASVRALAERHGPDRPRVADELARAGAGLRELPAEGASGGELRVAALAVARASGAELLFLDEPTRDLDDRAADWLAAWLAGFRGAAVVVSHDRRLLGQLGHFVRLTEAGCTAFSGSFAELERKLEAKDRRAQSRYLLDLGALEARERHNDAVSRRRRRKKNVGRVRELGRATPRIRLNARRGYAQESQGKRKKVQDARIEAVRSWAKESRRALTCVLPLGAVMPALPADDGAIHIHARGLAAEARGRTLFADLDVQVGRHRIAVTGPNGSGKTTLLRLLLGEPRAARGEVTARSERIGAVGQGALEWATDESLLARLARDGRYRSAEELTAALFAHRFPLALAERPLATLCPGERVRAALVCLLGQDPPPEVLVLDEPSGGLDLTGASALRELLAAWPGGLILASHDRDLLGALRFDRVIELDAPRPPRA